MFRVITLNLNGIRSAAKKGVFEWLLQQQADVICFQETKAQADILFTETFQLPGYQAFFHSAEKKGYSGVGIYTRHVPNEVKTGLGFELADKEGRYVAVKLGDVWIASIYMPSGTSGEERQAQKYIFLDAYKQHLLDILKNKQKYIICGDMNIAHKPIDLKNWRANQKNSGFLPAERVFMDEWFDALGFIDAFRTVNQEAEQYTWWSNRGQAWAKNVGWRLDYQILTPNLVDTVKHASIYKAERFSDHAPLIMDYGL